MELQKFINKLLHLASQHNFNDMEIFFNKFQDFDLRVFQQEIDHYALSQVKGISFRGLIDGKMGYAYTEKITEDALPFLVKKAKENALLNEKEEKEEIYAAGADYQALDTYSPALEKITVEEKIQLVKELEAEALKRDKRITAVNYGLYSDSKVEKKIINSKGLKLNFQNNIAYIYLSVVAQTEKEIKSAAKFKLSQDFQQFQAKKIAKEVVDEAISLLGAKSISSQNMPVILRYDVMAELLAVFSSTFSAENVQKGLSLFKNKLNQQVAATQVTILDNPFLKQGFRSSAFDGEGVPSQKKAVIAKGYLKTYLHNLKTAKKAGVETTANAYRSSHKSLIDIAPSNMYIKPGKTTYANLVKTLDEGLVITDVQGLHAGANPVSGDFSLSALGFYVKNGQIIHPVEQITIAGNFLELLQEIELIANDFTMSIPSSGHFGSPSVRVKKLAIAGD